MRKWIYTWVLAVCFSLLFPLVALGAIVATFWIGDTRYFVPGNTFVMDATPIVLNGRALLPVRYLAYACGVAPDNVYYDATRQSISIIKGTTVVQLQIGSREMRINDVTITMDVAPQVIDGRTFLPARYVAEALGYDVVWDEVNQRIEIVTRKEKRTIAELIKIIQPAVVFIETQRGQGTGFFISPTGEIITNVHVIAGARDIKVTTYDGRTFEATLVKAGPGVDIALLRVDGNNFPYIPIADERVQSGEEVLIFGHPLGVRNTVSPGIVSNPNKNVSELIPWKNFSVIQLSAPVYPGNSGGPVVNTYGEAIGVVFAKRKGADTISFAIPSYLCDVARVWPDFGPKEDFAMFAEVASEWFSQEEEEAKSIIQAVEQLVSSRQPLRGAISIETAIRTLESIKADVESYTAYFPEVQDLCRIYQRKVDYLLQAIIRTQQILTLADAAAYNIIAYQECRRLADEVYYYSNQAKYWESVFDNKFKALSERFSH